MKGGLIFIAITFLFIAAYSQAYQGNIEYDKQKQDCIIMDYNYPPDAVENAFRNKLSEIGYKGKEEKGLFNRDKGFRVYKGAAIDEISRRQYTYVVNIERKSRRDADESKLYLIILDEDKNALSSFDTEQVGKVKAFLYNLHPHIEAAHLEIRITSQEETISKEEKNLRKLEDDKDDLEKKLKKTEKEIEDKNVELENLRKVLEELKTKRKGEI